MADRYVVNQPVVLTCTFTVAGVATDPSTVSLVVTDPAGTATTYTYAGSTITKSSTGVYTKTVTASSAGTWSYVWTGTGTAADVQDGTFDVFPTARVNTNYATLDQVKQAKAITDTIDDSVLSIAIGAASRQIDGVCGRRFWQDGDVVTREYFPDGPVVCFTDDISTTTDLVVKVDLDLDGVFETTLVLNTDFMVEPRNAAFETPAQPYTELSIVPIGSQQFFPMPRYGRASVQVTAKFGWPAIPDDITQACIIQSSMIAKSKDAPFGAIMLGDLGQPMSLRSALHPMARALIAPYMKPALG